uniref:Retrovirus-related Pol polyprotein from transposon TNT 1-94 n=1 Tax=Anopheles atroparvus TaxID=41427 RepID=A0AAG5DT47_ANOAO
MANPKLAGSFSLPLREILRGSENYSSWSFATKMVLIKEKTWCAVKEPAEGEPAVSEETSMQALATICLSIDSSIYGLVRDAKNAKQAWDNLKNTYEHSGSTRKIGLLRRLTGIRLVGAERDEDIICQTTQQYVNELFTTSHQLAEVGFKVDDDWLASLLMKGLPKQYDPMILGLESSGIQLTADIVKAKILQDVKVSSEKQTVEAFLGNSKSTTKRSSVKSNVQCYRCKKMGHFASQCSNQFSDKKQEKSKNSGHATFFAAFNACQTSTAAEEEWIFDSGATSHLCRNRNLLVDAENVSSSINVANNTAVPVVAKGSVNVSADVGASTCAISMNDVLYVPELAVNLLSVSKMCQKGYTVTFRKQTCKVISPSNKLVAIGQESGGLYRLKRSPGSLVNMVSRMEDNFKLWHRRLCHMSVGCMKRLETMASGFEFRVTDGMQCVPCIQGKHHRHPFNIKGQRADRVLELIHSDLCGPMETASIGGNRYFITFIDDSSRKAFVYFLKSKTEVFETFKHFKSYAENQTGEKIKRIRSDNGREYMNREMKLFLCQAGIHHETSAPYTPEQNGLAERMNRTIVEKARSMLCDANLPKRFWAEAVATASYVINRSPTMGLRMTPHEAFTGRRPNLA